MISKSESNYYLNTSLVLFGLVCIVTGFMLDGRGRSGFNVRTLHIWTGYIMTGLIVAHLIMHVKWIGNVTMSILQNKVKVVALVTTIAFSAGVCYFVTKLVPNERLDPGFQGDRLADSNQETIQILGNNEINMGPYITFPTIGKVFFLYSPIYDLGTTSPSSEFPPEKIYPHKLKNKLYVDNHY